MPVSIIVFYTRRPDFSPAEFKDYMERVHVPIVKDVLGDHYPTSYRRRYIERVESGAGDRLGVPSASRKTAELTAPVVLVGPSELDWDMMGEFVFRDELHVQQGLAILNSPAGERIAEDEEHFTIPAQLKLILMGESFE